MQVKYLGDKLVIEYGHTHLAGDNILFDLLVEDKNIRKDIRTIEIDLANVEYINSLGLAEIVSIHRYYHGLNNGGTKIHIKNVDKKLKKLFDIVEFEKFLVIDTKPNAK